MPILHNLPGKILAAFIFVLPCFVQATEYYWKPMYESESFDDTKGYGSWSDLSNWSTESHSGADAAVLPGSSDTIYAFAENHLGWRQFDLGGGEWSISGWETGSNWDWNNHHWRFKNGTLHWTGRHNTHSDKVHLDDGATFIFDAGSFYRSSWGHGAPDEWKVYSGANLIMLGELNIHSIAVEIDDGGSMVFSPSSVDFNAGTWYSSYFRNRGSLSIPNGFSSADGASSQSFAILQEAGTLALGGPLSKNGQSGTYGMTISGGSLHITGDVSIDLTSATVTAPSLTIDIDDGAALDPSGLTFSAGISVSKTGAGDWRFRAGSIPDTFTVSGGSVLLDASDTAYDLTGITFTSGGAVKIGATNVTLSAWDQSLSSASFVAARSLSPADGTTVFACHDAAVLAAAAAGLNATFPGGISVETVGNSLVARVAFTFNSSTVTDMNDPDGWVGGAVGIAGQPIVVAGGSTDAVMDENVPSYLAISVVDGAALTIAATRNVPETTLEAGTAFNVASSGYVMQDESYAGYVMTTDTLVGTMDPAQSITLITDIAGHVGGTSWDGSFYGIPYSSVDVSAIDGGTKLQVQFKQWEPDFGWGAWTKCVIVEIWKDSAGNVYAKAVKAAYKGGDADYDFDFAGSDGYNTGDIATSGGQAGYGVNNLSFKAPVPAAGTEVVTATAIGEFATTGSGSVTVDVATNCVLDLSGVDVTTAATLVKTGDGAIVFGDELPTALDVEDGVLVLQPYVEYDMSGVTVAGEAVVKVAIDGAYKDGFPFVQQSGNTVYMPSGVYRGTGNWAAAGNWINSEIPDTSTTVHVHGEGTVLTLDDDMVTMPAGIVVEDGATLKVTASVTMPPLTLAPTARFEIGDNETMPATVVQFDSDPVASYRISGETVSVPSFVVATNATLAFSYHAKLKNMDMTICGLATTTANNVGDIIFGYAANGETTYFGLYADGATFHPLAYSWDAGCDHAANFVKPAAGGRVVQLRPFRLVRCAFPCSGWSDFAIADIGGDNPADEPCEIVFDSTSFHYTYGLNVSGSAKLRFVNGGSISYGDGATISDDCSVTLRGSSSIELDGAGTYLSAFHENAYFKFRQGGTGHESVVLKNCGAVRGFHFSGNGATVLAVHEGEWTVPKQRGSESPLNVLSGFMSADVKSGGVFSIVGRNEGKASWNDWDRDLVVAAPITGAGDVVVSNAVAGNSMAITVTSAANTCSGAISCNGDNNCRLLFADGANWAGTVVAGSVALTNTTEDAASTVSFNAVNLAGDFPIRVWKDGSTIVANDTLNVGSYVNNGGKLVPTGAEFALGDQIVVGKIAKNAVLPTAAPGWIVKTQPLDGDDANDELVLKRGCGLQVLVR